MPAINEKWPRSENMESIFIQHNAITHDSPTDYDFLAATSKNELEVRLTCQPANSPDFNVLDLGFF